MWSDPKVARYENEALRRAVASLPCQACGVQGYTQCAHFGGVAQGKGMGTKVNDSRTGALCGPNVGRPGCHYLFDTYSDQFIIAGVGTFDLGDRRQRYTAGMILIARTHITLIEHAKLKVVPWV